MEPKGTVSCAQKPATKSHPEQDEFGPHHQTLCLTSILILSLHLRLGLPETQPLSWTLTISKHHARKKYQQND